MNKKEVAGFSLLELILTVSIASLLLLSMTAVLQNVAEEELAVTTAEYMTEIGEATEDMLRDAINFDIIYSQAEGTGVFQFPVSYVRDGFDFGGGDVLLPSSKLSPGFTERSPLRVDISIIAVISDNNVDPDDPRALEVYIVTDDPVPDRKVAKVAEEIGGPGGIYRDNALRATDPVQSIYGTWEIAFSGFTNSAWHIAVSARALSIANGSYLVYFIYVNEEDVFGDYLYRTAQFTRPDLHTMNSDLNMANTHILGIDNAYVSGTTTVSQDFIAQGSAYVSGAATITGSYSVDELVTAGTLSLTGTDGSEEFFVQDQLTVGTNAFKVNEIQATTAEVNELRAHSVDTATINIAAGGLTIDHPDGLAANVLNSGGALTASGTANIADISTGTYTQSTTNNIAVLNLDAGSNLNVGGNLTVTTQFEAEGTTNISELGTCEFGCRQITE